MIDEIFYFDANFEDKRYENNREDAESVTRCCLAANE